MNILKIHSPSIKPFPPYGRQLLMTQEHKKLKNDIFLFIGHKSWELGKTFLSQQTILILPHDKQPEAYFWPVKDCSILVFDTDDFPKRNTIRKLAFVLLESGASVVRVALAHQKMVVYRR